MDILWPGFLILLGLIPLITAVYILLLRRRRRFAIRYSSLSLIREALPQQSRLRRHLPFVLFLLALVALIAALARPMLVTSVPSNQTTIILAIDVSLSMRQNDITPSRLEAAQAAALSFIQRQKSTTQIGIVAFSGFAELIQPPTTDQEALQAAIDSLTFGRRTAIGSGILKSIDAIAEIDKALEAGRAEADAPSLRFLAYLVRRLSSLPVLMVVATRPGESAIGGDLLPRQGARLEVLLASLSVRQQFIEQQPGNDAQRGQRGRPHRQCDDELYLDENERRRFI